MTEETTHAVHENLNTAYVNLAALLRYLQKRAFSGRVHVELIEYEADVYLTADDAPRVRGINHATGEKTEGDEAFKLLLDQASESGGLVSIYEGEIESHNGGDLSVPLSNSGIQVVIDSDEELSPFEQEWRGLIRLTGDLIAAVERATQSVSADFESLFRNARLELSEDYSFLDPLTECFEYIPGGLVLFHARPHPDAYVTSICEGLRRVVNLLAVDEHGGRLRERVALELAILARRKHSQLSRFRLVQQFDRIAGTRVL
jgi:hypothetical protein